MNAKLYLENYKKLEHEKAYLEKTIKDLENISVRSRDYQQQIRGGWRTSSTESIAIKTEELRERLQKKREKAMSLQVEIIDLLDKLDDSMQKDVLYRYYVKFERIESIADDLYYTCRSILRIKKKGLSEVDSLLGVAGTEK